MNCIEVSDSLLEKIEDMRVRLGVKDREAVLEKSLNIAHFVAETIKDPESKLLLERRGKYTWLQEID